MVATAIKLEAPKVDNSKAITSLTPFPAVPSANLKIDKPNVYTTPSIAAIAMEKTAVQNDQPQLIHHYYLGPNLKQEDKV